jgi:RecA-family ATPase
MAGAAQNITRHFGGDWHGSYGAIPTPGHSPRDRGCTVKDADGGEVLFYAHNDPAFDWRGLKDECRRLGLIPDRDTSVHAEWRETGSYTYRNAAGDVVYRTVRKEKRGEAKRFEAQRLEGGRWVNKLDTVERVPYRLPELLAADPAAPVYFVEGERKADKLASWGLVATAIAFGCKGWRREYAQHFVGRTVVILPDNDDVGREFAAKVKEALGAVANDVAIIDLPGLRPKGDVIDWTGTADDLRALTVKALADPGETFPIADLASWSATAATPKSFIMAGYVPARELTLATGAGGANKSTFGQQLATCCAAGLPMLGIDVAQGSALYITAEDDDDRLHWMQEHICRALGVRMVDLVGKLHLASLRGRLGNELATFDAEGKLRPSPSFRVLRATIAQAKARLVVLDNAAHLFAGNENDRGQVTAFVNLLYSLCVDLGTTIILVAHSNKAGDTYSGSTAWLNAVRSQIVLSRPDGAIDPDERVLTLGKANYARQGDELRFRWHDFALVRDRDLPSDVREELSATIQANLDNDIFLRCLDERNRQERAVSESKASRTYAPKEFAAMPESKGIGRGRLEAAMDRLFRTGAIERGIVGRYKGEGKDMIGLRRTADDLNRTSDNLSDDVPMTPSDDVPMTYRRPPKAHTPILRIEGAAPEAAAPSSREGLERGSLHPSPRLNGAAILAPGEALNDEVPGWQ